MATLATSGGGVERPRGRLSRLISRLRPARAPAAGVQRLSDEAWLLGHVASAHLEGHGRDYRATSYGAGSAWHP